MDLICASICYRGYVDDEVEGTLANAPRIGYRLMEIHGPMTWSVEAVERFDLPAVRARIERAGMRCAGLYSPGWGGQDEREVEVHARAIARCVELAQELGGRHVTSSGACRRGEPGALDRVIQCARQVLALAPGQTPVRLALEPHYGNVLEQLEDFERVLDACPDPRLGVCVDTGHFHSARVDMPGLIRRFGPRVYNVHLKDHVGVTSVGIGRGEIDLPRVVEALEGIGYAGDLTVELEVVDPENLPRYTEEAYHYLRGLLGQRL
jgi:sugar phosphate isomerase/epimerase